MTLCPSSESDHGSLFFSPQMFCKSFRVKRWAEHGAILWTDPCGKQCGLEQHR